MTNFNKREQGFENKFAHDNELEFKANAKRNKLLGLWAAEKLHLKDNEKEDYASKIIAADFKEVGSDDVLQKIIADFKKSGVKINTAEIRREMDYFLKIARKEITNN